MTRELVESELERTPFIPFRLHLVSGKTVDVTTARGAEAMGNSVMLFHPSKRPGDDGGYDMIPLHNIERLEQLEKSE